MAEVSKQRRLSEGQMSDHSFFLVEGSEVVSEQHTIRDNDHFDVSPAGVEVVAGDRGFLLQ